MIRIVDLVTATGGTLVFAGAAAEVSGFCYDSRLAQPGELFVAVVTDSGDGHDYVLDALSRGVSGVLCQRVPEGGLPDGIACIQVDDTQQALLDYAAWVLADRDVRVVGVTGSVGKTSTKEAIASVLECRLPVFRNEGSYNGRYGLPIALGRLRDEKLAILEMASDSPDEIRELVRLCHPLTGVVTAVGRSHLADLGDLESIAQEKGRLVEALPEDGLAILNGDDPHVRDMAHRTRARVVLVGQSSANDLWADDLAITSQGTSCTVHDGRELIRLQVPWLGAHHANTMLIAYAVGREYGLSAETIALGLSKMIPLPGRLRPLAGRGGSLLLDDTFNASPESFAAALDTLAALPARRRWVVMGDMADLGREAEALHRDVGRRVSKVSDRMVAKGDLAALAADEALRAGMSAGAVRVSYSQQDVLEAVGRELADGDLVLIKGSAAARMEQIVRGLLAESEEPEQVLVRQNSGWQAVHLRRPGRPTWVEVDLDAIANNTRLTLNRLAPGVELMAVLKADAYGHGARRVARTVINKGATWLGVACLGEGIELRQAGIRVPILNLGYTPAWQAREAVRHDIASTIFSLDVAQALARAGRDLGRPASVHVKVDTGMGRLGLLSDEVLPLIRAASSLPGLEVQGLFSHLASADEEDLAHTDGQLAAFSSVVEQLRREHLLPLKVHVANSAATIKIPASHYNMVRAGIILYGLAPSPETPLPEGYRAAMSFKCQIAQVKELPAGSCVGYGCTYVTQAPARIAVIPVGYADGFRRSPRHWEYVLVRGHRAPVVGRVCMDQTMVDVSGIASVRQGDEVTLIGTQGEETLSAEDVAGQLGTINYEVVSEILARVPRVV